MACNCRPLETRGQECRGQGARGGGGEQEKERAEIISMRCTLTCKCQPWEGGAQGQGKGGARGFTPLHMSLQIWSFLRVPSSLVLLHSSMPLPLVHWRYRTDVCTGMQTMAVIELAGNVGANPSSVCMPVLGRNFWLNCHSSPWVSTWPSLHLPLSLSLSLSILYLSCKPCSCRHANNCFLIRLNAVLPTTNKMNTRAKTLFDMSMWVLACDSKVLTLLTYVTPSQKNASSFATWLSSAEHGPSTMLAARRGEESALALAPFHLPDPLFRPQVRFQGTRACPVSVESGRQVRTARPVMRLWKRRRLSTDDDAVRLREPTMPRPEQRAVGRWWRVGWAVGCDHWCWRWLEKLRDEREVTMQSGTRQRTLMP